MAFRNHLLLFATLIILSLLATTPFWGGRMPMTADGELHLYRIIALDHALRADNPIWPRYASGMVYGYGAPLFHYFSPLAFHLPRFLHVIGASFQAGWLWSMIIYTVLAAGGAFLWGQWWAGRLGGLATAAAYIYAPYFLFDTAARGTLSETAALALLPYVFWAFSRLAERGGRGEFLLATSLFALFIPLHNIVTLHGTALLALYCLLLLMTHGRPRLNAVQFALVGLCAIGMTAFFWWPALGDTAFVKLAAVTANLPDINPTKHLRPLAELFSFGFTADPTQQGQPIPIVLGWPQLLLSSLGILLSFRGHRLDHRPARLAMVFLGLLVALLIALNLPFSAPLWEQLPLMRYTQFAWRTLGPASLLLALMAGMGTAILYHAISRQTPREIFLAIAVGGMMLYSIPWLYRPIIPDPPAQSIRDFHEMERRTGNLTASSFAEYVPIWNKTALDGEALRQRFASADVIPRLIPPSDVTVHSAEWGGTWGRLTLSAGKSVVLTFDWLYFVGWTAYLNGESLTVQPSSETGLIQVAIPAGEHQLYIALGPTPTETRATILSAIALAFSLVVMWRWPRVKTTFAPQNSYSHLSTINITCLAIIVIKITLIDPYNTPFKTERFQEKSPALSINFNNQIELIDADLPSFSIPSGEALPLALYWRVIGGSIPEDYSSIVHLRDTAGNIIAEGGSFAPGGLATSNWLSGYYIRETLSIPIPQGTTPGNYALDVGLYRPQSGERISVINAMGNPEDAKAQLGAIAITRPATSPPWDNSAQRVTDELYFLGLKEALPNTRTVGDEIIIRWRWGLRQSVEEIYLAQLLWLDATGKIVTESQSVPLALGYPTNRWRAGDQWLGHHRLYVPSQLKAGDYTLALQIVDAHEARIGEPIIVGKMIVHTPPRTYRAPNPAVARGDKWENGIRLLGYDLNADTLSLYWQTSTALNESLRLFVHFVNADGHIISQTDGVPADWTRPTTGWDIGEIITTYHPVVLPSGDYIIRIGWYHPDTNKRIPLLTGGDMLDVATISR